MRRVNLIVLVSMLVVLFFAAGASADFKKTRIAVLDFQLQGEGFETKDMGKIVAEWITTGLVQAGRFDVIERSLLEKILKEQELPMYGVVDAKSAAKTGMIVGAKVVITGSVMKLRQEMEVSARLINVEDGSIIAAEKVKSDSTGRLEDLVSRMVDKVILDFPLEGYIVAIGDNNSVIVDLGKSAGAKTGKRFVAYKEGKVIKHPKTGEVLDIERIETGVIELKDVKGKTSTAVIVREIPPYKIEYGNMVRSENEQAAGYSPYAMTSPSPAQEPVAPDYKAVPVQKFEPGQEYFVLTTLHTVKNYAEWENRTDWPPIRAGEKVKLTALEKYYAKFIWNGKEITFEYQRAKSPNHALLSKFLTNVDPSPRINEAPEDVKSVITQGGAKSGMTKWEVLFSKGVPTFAGDRRSFDMTLDDVLNTNRWIYAYGHRKVIIDFSEGRAVTVRE